jgi:hypothetical protein
MTCFVNWWRKHWKGMDLELFNNIVINHNNTYKLLNCQCFVRSQLPVFCEISTASVLWDLNCQCFVRSQLPVFCEISTVSVLWDLNCQCFVRSQLSVFCEISTVSVLWDLNCQCFVRSQLPVFCEISIPYKLEMYKNVLVKKYG